MVMIKCDKCLNLFDSESWEKGKTYTGIDRHHNPPEFMVDKWEGIMYHFCRQCHRKLHDEIIKILNEGTLKFVNSEHWAWIKIPNSNKQFFIDKIITFTNKWVREHDTKQTP